MALASMNPTANAVLLASPVSSNVLIPTTGTPTMALIQNLGSVLVWFAVGIGSGVTATTLNTPLQPGGQFALTIGTNTFLAAIAASGNAQIAITVGT